MYHQCKKEASGLTALSLFLTPFFSTLQGSGARHSNVIPGTRHVAHIHRSETEISFSRYGVTKRVPMIRFFSPNRWLVPAFFFIPLFFLFFFFAFFFAALRFSPSHTHTGEALMYPLLLCCFFSSYSFFFSESVCGACFFPTFCT